MSGRRRPRKTDADRKEPRGRGRGRGRGVKPRSQTSGLISMLDKATPRSSSKGKTKPNKVKLPGKIKTSPSTSATSQRANNPLSPRARGGGGGDRTFEGSATSGRQQYKRNTRPTRQRSPSGLAMQRAQQEKKGGRDSGRRIVPSLESKEMEIESTINNLVTYLDWRNPVTASPDFNSDLWVITLTIWEFLPPSSSFDFNIHLGDPTVTSYSLDETSKHPILIHIGPNGDIIYAYTCRRFGESGDKKTHIVVASNFTELQFDVRRIFLQSERGGFQSQCRFFEVPSETHEVTHVIMDNDKNIFYTEGENIWCIEHEAADAKCIWMPPSDTSQITSLWRQDQDKIFFSVQDWENEEVLELFRLYSGSDWGTPTSPITSPRGARAPSSSIGTPRSPRSPRTSGRLTSNRSIPLSSPSSTTRLDANMSSSLFVKNITKFALKYNARVWQLRWLRNDKKWLLGLSAIQQNAPPRLMRISNGNRDLELLDLTQHAFIRWGHSFMDDGINHLVFPHRPSRTWLCVLSPSNMKTNEKVWIQFRLNGSRNQVVYSRVLTVPEVLGGADGDPTDHNTVQWCVYDEIRDCLVGWRETSGNAYSMVVLPHLSGILDEMTRIEKEKDDVVVVEDVED